MSSCQECGKENNEDANFCQYCGMKLANLKNEKQTLSEEEGQIGINLSKGFDLNFELILNFVIAILIISDTFLLLLMDFSNVSPITAQNITNFDLVVCFALFCEFMFRLRAAEDKKEFFKDKNNWITIIAMIPINFFAFRLLRYIKILPLIYRGLKHFNKFLKETHLNWSFGILILAISSGTLLFYILERGINGHINNLWDSFLYVVPTTVTAGSNIYPQTTAGEIVGMGLMITGLICFGLFTASIASNFIKSDEQDDNTSDLDELKLSMKNMENKIEELKELIENK